MEYIPEQFASLAHSNLGKRLWAFLLEPQTIVRLETATALERPAVEGIEEQILQRFDADVMEDRVKQMIGHMTRQIMESHGYVVAQGGVRMTNGAPFSRATRYVRRGELNYHVFRSVDNPRCVLVAVDKTVVLPDAANWHFWKLFKGELRACIALGLPNIREATEEMRRLGYYRHEIPRLLRAA